MSGCEKLTHSRMSCFKSCPMKHYLRYELGWVPAEEKEVLRMGTAFHLGLEIIGKGLGLLQAAIDIQALYHTQIDEADEERAAALEIEMHKVCCLVAGHHDRWGRDDYRVVGAEMMFSGVGIGNPDTAGRSRTYELAGKIDRIVKLPDGRLAVHEYKTTGYDIEPGSDFWNIQRLSQQTLAYVVGARALGYYVTAVVVDATRRPGIRPRKLLKKDIQEIEAQGGRCPYQVGDRETPQLYSERLSENIAANPDRYFQRIEMGRTEQEIDLFRAELWQIAAAMRDAKASGRHYRNTSACLIPYRCDYLPICGSAPGPDDSPPPGFKVLEDVHPELATEVTR